MIDRVLKILTSNRTFLRVPLALEGLLAAVMAMPMVRMPALFEEAGPSQGGRESIFESDDNIHCNLGTNPIFVTPFPQIPLYGWSRNQIMWKNKPSTASPGQLSLLFQVGKQVTWT